MRAFREERSVAQARRPRTAAAELKRDLAPRPGRRAAVLVVILALLAIATRGALAQSEPSTQPPSVLKKMSLEELFDLEVTSVSQKPESLSKTSAAIHVVTHDDVQRMGALSIPEALRYIPGVEVARVDSRQYAITARGFNGTVANKLLVLIDGRSVYTPLYSGVFWDVQDAFMDDIEQIEVIRGPGATVWGANAVNGVINVITKDAAHTQGLLVTGGAGNAERGFGGARYGGTLGSHAFYRVYGKSFDRAPSLLPSRRAAGDDFRISQGGVRIDWTPSATDGRSRVTPTAAPSGNRMRARRIYRAATPLRDGRGSSLGLPTSSSRPTTTTPIATSPPSSARRSTRTT
ncbi:MAG: hypothetical protein E6K73_10745 [Candidatus Eisenbacteria bacterium]|uniref:TonB-dependent receptor plug domain-containing protein n=1 Tax=Eiseniibacteriota bacterium TaxID=2212470 RepID=A0A538SC50_UNCEI|nr:MAG: hypothetical protein E6K73_10745 [Candidatus Eisenbacteria bacterium]